MFRPIYCLIYLLANENGIKIIITIKKPENWMILGKSGNFSCTFKVMFSSHLRRLAVL